MKYDHELKTYRASQYQFGQIEGGPMQEQEMDDHPEFVPRHYCEIEETGNAVAFFVDEPEIDRMIEEMKPVLQLRWKRPPTEQEVEIFLERYDRVMWRMFFGNLVDY